MDKVMRRTQYAGIRQVPPHVRIPKKFDWLSQWLSENQRHHEKNGCVQEVPGKQLGENTRERTGSLGRVGNG